ncbi:MAG: cytochrome-c peroxidase [Woeseia sp.]|nr:cytochrome-c peroxidase [Woeseia sp.]
MSKAIKMIATIAAILAITWFYVNPTDAGSWTKSELRILEELSIYSLPPLPPDVSNAVAQNIDAARFGHSLFFDKRMSANRLVSCATCHSPEKQFSDGLPKGRGIGLSDRNTRTIVGSAYSPWQYWDGRKDSQWSQALSPLEDPDEHGGNRMYYARFISEDPEYRRVYESLFGSLSHFNDKKRFPDAAGPIGNPAVFSAWENMTTKDRHMVNIVFANIGKVLAAYQRLIIPGESKFDYYVEAVLQNNNDKAETIFTKQEIRGLRLFINEAKCTDCHNGPLFTNNEFHNTGNLSFPGEMPDRGRIDGVRKVLADPFNCLGPYSDDPTRNCPELTFVRKGAELIGAMRTPTLRNLEGTAPFGHKGQFQTLGQVLEQYNDSPLAMIGHNEVENPLGLSTSELESIEAFLNTLNSPLTTSPEWLNPPRLGISSIAVLQ